MRCVATFGVAAGLCLGSIAMSVSHADEGKAKQKVEVVVSGAGLTESEAVKSAFRNAVEQVVGVAISTDTLVRNSAVIQDRILSYSDGFVTTWQMIGKPRKEATGLVRVQIKATVSRTKLYHRLQAANVISAEVRGKDLFAEAITQLKEEKDAARIIRKVFEHFPGNVLKAEPMGRPRIISRSETEVVVGMTVQFTVALSKYARWVKAFKPYLSKVAVKALPRRWNPKQVGLKRLGNAWQNKDWGSLSVPKRELQSCLIPAELSRILKKRTSEGKGHSQSRGSW